MDDLTKLTLVCLRCSHTWLRRHVHKPAQCPKCKSPYWNKLRLKPKPPTTDEGGKDKSRVA